VAAREHSGATLDGRVVRRMVSRSSNRDSR
jgi:hypothetical protein